MPSRTLLDDQDMRKSRPNESELCSAGARASRSWAMQVASQRAFDQRPSRNLDLFHFRFDSDQRTGKKSRKGTR
jgi:hypothetical protein